MAEKTLTVRYKKSRNSNTRAFKIWDTEYLYESMQDAVNIKHTLDKLSEENNADFSNLGMATIPINVLHGLANSYIESYNKLLKEALIKSANISKIQPTIN